MTKCFPIGMENLVIHALFRMRLIEMRHNVFRKWAFSHFPNYAIPIEYATKDDVNNAIIEAFANIQNAHGGLF